MTTVIIVWGNPREAHERLAFEASLRPGASFRLSADGRYASAEMGPTTVEGPVITHVPAGENTEPETVVVLAGQDLPAWVASSVPREWGWEPVSSIPQPTRLPFQVDVLLLSMSVGGELEGMSTTLWFDAGVRPLQRTTLQVDPNSDLSIDVHILEAGSGQHATGFVVAYAPDRDQVDQADLASHGWWNEPWVQVRGGEWKTLAKLSEAVETNVVTLLRNPIAADVTIHDLLGIPDEGLRLLPSDVRGGLETALLSYGEEEPSEATTGGGATEQAR